MNIACSTTGFTKHSLEDALARISAMGFSFVDLLMMENWAHINPSELIGEGVSKGREVSRLLRKYGLKSVALNTNVSGKMTSEDPAVIEQNLVEVKALVDFAREIGTTIVVVQPGADDGDAEQAFQASTALLRRMTEYARERGTVLAIENHSNTLAEAHHDALRFVTEVPGLKIAYDPSHCIKAELDLEGSRALLAHSVHVHLRDAVIGNFQAPMGKGKLDFMWVFEAIDAAGYNAAISIEYIDGEETSILNDIGKLKTLLETRYAHI